MHWWGGSLEGIRPPGRSVSLNVPQRLVFAPHVYGPSVHQMTYFTSADFPTNMHQIWQDHWYFAIAQTGVPAVVTEWGGWYTHNSSEIPAGQGSTSGGGTLSFTASDLVWQVSSI